MANEVAITISAKDQTSSGFSSAQKNAQSFGKEVESSSSSAGKSVAALGEHTDKAATAAGTASGAFGALSSGIALTQLKGQQHIQELQNENANIDVQKDKIDAQIAALEKSSTAKDADKKAIDAQVAALKAHSASLDDQKTKNDDAAQAITDHQQKMATLTTVLMGGQLAFDAISGAADLSSLALAGSKVATVAQGVASKVTAAATKAWAGAQWLMNAALEANPIGIVVIAIIALIAIIVIAYKRSDTFRAIVQAAFRAVKAAAITMKNGLVAAFNAVVSAFRTVQSRISSTVSSVRSRLSSLVSFARGIPGRIASAFSSLYGAITNPVRNAIGAVKSWLNGLLSFARSIPSRIGNSVKSAIPGFAHGGIIGGAATGGARGGLTMVGENGPELLRLPGGSRVRSNADSRRIAAGSGSGGAITLMIESSGSAADKLLVELIRKSVRIKGGNVQAVLGT